MATEKPKVSEKNTKAQILAEYEKTLGKLNEAKAASLNPAQVKQARRKKEVVQKSSSLNTEAVEKSINTVKNRAFTLLGQLETQLTEELGNLGTVQEAIKVKEEELQEIFGIEREASSLAALVESQRQLKEQFNDEQNVQRTAFQDEMARARKAWAEEKAEHARVAALENQRLQEQRDRELEEFKYNFERQQREETDALRDALAAERKQFEEQVEVQTKALNSRIEEVTKRELAVTDLEAKVERLEREVATKVEAAIEDTKKSMNASKAIAESSIRKDYEAQITVLNGRLDTTTEQLTNARSRVERLETDLASARAEVQAVAMRALDAGASKEALAAVQSTISASSGQTKR